MFIKVLTKLQDAKRSSSPSPPCEDLKLFSFRPRSQKHFPLNIIFDPIFIAYIAINFIDFPLQQFFISIFSPETFFQTDMPCTIDHLSGDHLSHSIDLVTTLRSELAALTYKRDRLMHDLTDTKAGLCAKENECEGLRAQGARQSALIMSFQQRLQATETREKNLTLRSEQTSSTLQREKRCLEEKVKEMCSKQRRLECDLSSEENLREQAKAHLNDLVRKLGCVLGMDVTDSTHITSDCVLTKSNDVVNELQRLRSKLAATCESLTTCESELHGLRNASSTERSHLNAQIESLKTITTGLEARCKCAERDLQLTRDRLTESEMGADKLRGELDEAVGVLSEIFSWCSITETTFDLSEKFV